MVKVKKTSTKNIKITNITIDYENGIKCYVIETIKTEIEQKVSFTYTFKINNTIYNHVSNIEELLDSHWNQHYDIMKSQKFNTIDDLVNFTDFENLCYVQDGMIKDIHGRFKASRIFLDYSFFKIYCGVNDCVSVGEIVPKLEKISNIENIKHIQIPYYNGGGSGIECDIVNLSDDIYSKSLGSKSHVDNNVKQRIIEYLMKEKMKK